MIHLIIDFLDGRNKSAIMIIHNIAFGLLLVRNWYKHSYYLDLKTPSQIAFGY